MTLCKNLNVRSSVTDTDASNKAVVDAQPTQDEHTTTTASAMVNQNGVSSEATQAMVTKTKGAVSTSEQQEPAKSKLLRPWSQRLRVQSVHPNSKSLQKAISPKPSTPTGANKSAWICPWGCTI